VIGVCGFDYHFADFSNYRESAFVKKMKSMFYDANLSTVFSDTWMNILFASHFRRQSSIKVMNGLVDDVIQKRLIDPAAHRDKRDFLSLMLDGADKKDGSKLDQENIRHQLITFLAAGYETTAALLGFCFYYLIKYPEVAHKARASVDAVFANKAGDHLTFKDISGLGYLKMVTHEALRLWPTASGFFLGPKAKTIVDGQYEVTPDDVFFVSLPGIHRDPAVWGEGADTFDPEHFSPQRVKQTPRNAFKPFGNGVRACIGRHFAITEVIVILAHALRAFDFIDYADYQLSVDESVTLKVKNFSMKVKPRKV
ncbi:MAG: cytochrome P450, partial [Myxococcota bacterium]|nr:cytochrome P450 [Myxococcota bacterium]